MELMSKLHDVAKAAGVSPATVSRSFRTPDLLSQQTRRRVQEAASRLGYRPRRRRGASAYSPRTRTSGFLGKDAVGFLFFGLDSDGDRISDFYSHVLMGAQAEAARIGLHLVVDTLPRLRPVATLPKMLREDAVAGMLLVGAAPSEVLAPLQHIAPIVLVDNKDGNDQHDTVLSDDFGGMFELTRHLLGLGHREIGFVMNEPTAPSFQARYRGYMSALFDAAITPDRNWIITADSDETVDRKLLPMLKSPNRPTAIVAANDTNAFHMMRACRDAGLRVPGDISIAGFDDVPFSIHTSPPLTTVRVDKHTIGRMAVRRLQTRILEAQEGAVPEPAIHMTVRTSLVIRESCASLAH